MTNRPIRHFGFLVKDADAYTKSLSTAFPDLSEWKWGGAVFTPEEMVVGPPCEVRGATACVDGVWLEVVEAVNSPDSYQAQNAYGLHHIAYVYEGTFEEEKQRLLSEGFTIDWAATRTNGEEVYYFKPPIGGYVVELNNNFDYEKGVVRS